MLDLKSIQTDPCPFCGHEYSKVRFKQHDFHYTDLEKKYRWKCYVVCNKCLSRGAPVTTGWMLKSEGDPHNTIYEGKMPTNADVVKNTETFKPFAEEAIRLWNKREWY